MHATAVLHLQATRPAAPRCLAAELQRNCVLVLHAGRIAYSIPALATACRAQVCVCGALRVMHRQVTMRMRLQESRALAITYLACMKRSSSRQSRVCARPAAHNSASAGDKGMQFAACRNRMGGIWQTGDSCLSSCFLAYFFYFVLLLQSWGVLAA